MDVPYDWLMKAAQFHTATLLNIWRKRVLYSFRRAYKPSTVTQWFIPALSTKQRHRTTEKNRCPQFHIRFQCCMTRAPVLWKFHLTKFALRQSQRATQICMSNSLLKKNWAIDRRIITFKVQSFCQILNWSIFRAFCRGLEKRGHFILKNTVV